jgi:hypothetical protein
VGVKSVPWLGVILALSSLASRAEALKAIHFERWTIPPAIPRDVAPPVDTVTFVGFSFDATSTATDLDPAHGFQFSLAEHDLDGDDVLARLELKPCTAPAPGTDVYVFADVALYCDGRGELRARDSSDFTVTWCDYPQQRVCSRQGPFPAASLPQASDAERYEFVLLDEGDVEGAFPTPEDVTECGDSRGPSAQYVAPDFPEAGSVGIYADPGAALCSARVDILTPFRWYVIASLAGMSRCGGTLFELGADALPPGMLMSVTPNPHAFPAFGTLFGGTAGISFPCERGANDLIILYTLDGIATTSIQDFTLGVHAGNPPSNMYWPYPWHDLCPFPFALRRRLEGKDFLINPSPGHTCDTLVHVQRTSWTALKSLYR